MDDDYRNELFTAEQSRTLDQLTGEAGFILMKKAGEAVYQEILTRWQHLATQGTLHIFCGAGNNAGDGYVIATCALQAGMNVNVVAIKPPETLKGDAALAWKSFVQKKGKVSLWTPEMFTVNNLVSEHDVIVDALLGTGLNGCVSDNYRVVIEGINALCKPVVSVDIPSGLSADTGAVMGVAVQATMTVTLIALKQGLFTAEGPQLCGECVFADLNTSPAIYKQVCASSYLMDVKAFAQMLKPRKENTNKGSFGHLLLIGGDEGMGGAIIMAAEAALASGVGRVTVLTHDKHITALLTRCPEIMVHARETTDIATLIKNKTAVAVGPGLGMSDWGQIVLKTLKKVDLPLLFDADALNLIANDPLLLSRSHHHVFTPHPGEAARLLHSSADHVQQNRFMALETLQKTLGGCVALKGSGTLVSAGNEVFVCDKGNAGMAVAGCGDVLSGLVGGLLAQGYNPLFSTSLGVWLHASAGDKAVENFTGNIGLRATELIPLIRQQINQIIAKGKDF